MPIPAAYATVVVIWSTTPLAIVWSSESVSPVMAVMARMAIAAVLGWGIVRVMKVALPWHKRACQSYLAAVLGIFGGMICAYMAARFVPSGLISVLFGLAPILSGVLAQHILNEQRLSPIQWGASLLALAGLGIIFMDDLAVGGEGLYGILLLLVGVSLYSLSGVLVKKTAAMLHPMAQTVGALICSMPFFLVAWWLLDGTVPVIDWSSHSPWAILYLAIFGSLLGFICFYYVLQHLPAKTVALITLITPMFALTLGTLLNDEPLTLSLLTGALVIIVGLALYQWGDRWWRLLGLRQRPALDNPCIEEQ